MIKLIAFDWNGTLLADTKVTVLAENKALKNFGLKPITVEILQNTFDVPIINYWRALGLSDAYLKQHMHSLNNEFHKFYEPLENKARLTKGSVSLLKFLNNNGIKAIIYSNHIQAHIKKQLVRLKINKLINQILARKKADTNHLSQRQKEMRLVKYLKLKNIKPSEVISVGDTVEELEISKSQGYYSAAIIGGHNSITRLKKHKPDFLINNMSELKSIIKKLNGK